MTGDRKPTEPAQPDAPDAADKPPTTTERADRLAAALRENLKKRKAQARQRKQAGSTADGKKAD